MGRRPKSVHGVPSAVAEQRGQFLSKRSQMFPSISRLFFYQPLFLSVIHETMDMVSTSWEATGYIYSMILLRK